MTETIKKLTSNIDNSLNLPNFLKENFLFEKYSNIKIDNIYVGLHSLVSKKIIYKKIFETPHYTFVKKVITGEEPFQNSGYKDYGHYITINKSNSSELKYLNLINNILKNGYDWNNKPILVFRSWRRPIPFNRWYVADGFHRLAILAAMNNKNIKLGILKRKFTIKNFF